MAKKGNGLKADTRDEIAEQRPVRYRTYQYLFLIVCEDEQTEPVYFGQFKAQIPDKTLFLKTVGTGRDPLGVVERAVAERDKLQEESGKEVDTVWAVFDKDDADENGTKTQRFNDAFEIGGQQNIELAYSNEVFELWLLLHLTNVDSRTALPRQDIYRLLEAEIQRRSGFQNFTYQHGNPAIIEKIRLLGDESAAIRRAERLFETQLGRPPIAANPNTRVHLLVKKLRELITYFSWTPE